jgi:hypothetical protein
MSYTLATHQHRFAAWAAARAAQRGLANSRTGIIIDALKGCSVEAVVNTESMWPTTAAGFDSVHRDWCRALLRGLPGARYGRAAKIIAIYLKSRIVLSGHHESLFATVIHPPIDRVLLQSLARHVRVKDPGFARYLRTRTWTSLNEDEYYDLIARLRRAGLDLKAFWYIEEFWDPRGEDEATEEAAAAEVDETEAAAATDAPVADEASRTPPERSP